MRTLNQPSDIDGYFVNRQVYRRMEFNKMPKHDLAPIPGIGGVIAEAKWGTEYEDDGVTEKHPAEEVSFAERADGSWHKITSLRLDLPRDEWPVE